MGKIDTGLKYIYYLINGHRHTCAGRDLSKLIRPARLNPVRSGTGRRSDRLVDYLGDTCLRRYDASADFQLLKLF